MKTRGQILQLLKDEVREYGGKFVDEITEESEFIKHDLDSLDRVEIAMNLEERLHCQLDKDAGAFTHIHQLIDAFIADLDKQMGRANG